MNNSKINIGLLLSSCIDAAEQSGEIIRNIWNSGKLEIKNKGWDDPCTKADILSQQLIMGLLRQKWGNNLTIVGEETCEIPNLSKYPNLKLIDLEKVPSQLREVDMEDICIFIDPLDATKEFTEGYLDAILLYI
jgi:3'(2'), 5'-bisphosphate nucleotidase